MSFIVNLDQFFHRNLRVNLRCRKSGVSEEFLQRTNLRAAGQKAGGLDVALSRALGGSCRVPLAAYCEPTPEGGLRMRACIASLDGATLISAEAAVPRAGEASSRELGATVAASLLAQGAQAFVPAG